jgi:hypothetical protein
LNSLLAEELNVTPFALKKQISNNEGKGFLSPEIPDELVKGTYTVNIQPLLDSVSFYGLDYDENEDIPPCEAFLIKRF